MMAEIDDKNSAAAQKLSWEALRKSLNGLINKVRISSSSSSSSTSSSGGSSSRTAFAQFSVFEAPVCSRSLFSYLCAPYSNPCRIVSCVQLSPRVPHWCFVTAVPLLLLLLLLLLQVNAPNIKDILPELFQENLMRGRGLFCQVR
jgi:hypothetical protein